MTLTAGNVQAEVGLLRARQLAMQREIHDLRTELQRRDRTMHRELSALRMEMDALRAEIPVKQSKVTGLQVPHLSPSAIKVPAPVPPKSSPAPAQATPSSSTTSTTTAAELKRPEPGNGITPKAT